MRCGRLSDTATPRVPDRKDSRARLCPRTKAYYAATAYVPPHAADTSLASFILRNFDAGAWRSCAEGRWLAADAQGSQLVRPGSVIAVTEGARGVAYCTVQHRSEEHTSELQSHVNLVCRLLLEKKKKI